MSGDRDRHPGGVPQTWIPAWAIALENSMRLLSRFFVFLVVLCCALPGKAADAQQQPLAQKRILLLYAYGYGGRGVELFSDGFFKAMAEAGFPATNVFAEYLDLQRNREVPGYREELREMLLKKYARIPIDLIVTLQQPALGFLLTEGRDIAPQAPVITIQHRPLLDEEKSGRHIVGEVNQFDIKGTLERALEIFPQTRRVVFVSGSSEADAAIAGQVVRIVEPWRGKLDFEFTTGMSIDEILRRVAELPPHSVIVFTQYNRDAKGHVALAYEAENMIVKVANAPVFGFYDYNLRNGGIGGSVIPVEASGSRTARLALDLLRGVSSAQAGLLSTKENVPMFDWQQIERWGGDTGRLPAHTVFVNRPPSAWQQYGVVIVGTTAFILLLGMTIVALVLSMRRRRRAERVLDESEQRFRATFEQAAVGIALVSPDGRWLRVNDRLCEIAGYSRDELLACRFQDITHPDDLEADRLSVRKMVAGEIRTAALEKRYLRKDGSIVWVNVTFSLLRKQDGQPDYFIAMVEDIRARKEAERALSESQAAMLRGREEARLAALNQMEDAIAAKKSAELAEDEIRRLNADLERRVIERTAELTEANKELDSFAYAVSHDLRAPLRAMSGFSEALREEYGDRLDGEAKTYLDQIGIASRKMGERIDGILALSRSARGEIRRDAVDVTTLSASILAGLARGEPGRKVAAEIEPGLTAHGDARMVESIMGNLLGNAWKYTGKTETPRIRVTSCELDGEPGIAVADNGDGFDMAHADQLFKPFRRLHRQDEFPGTGIGLATVQRIVHRHGGKLRASAAPGQGATFCFTLGQASGDSP